MRNYNIIALCGSKGSGKDTVAQLIREVAIDPVHTVAFADPIKDQIQRIYNLNPDSNEQYDLFKRTDVSFQLPGYLSNRVEGRQIVREIGMLMRSYDEGQFVRYVIDQIQSRPSFTWVVTDVRFPNEMHAMIQMGAKIVNVVRPGYTSDGHVTERGFTGSRFDYTISNTSSIDDLRVSTLSVMKEIYKEWTI